jgi:hypothetical protein
MVNERDELLTWSPEWSVAVAVTLFPPAEEGVHVMLAELAPAHPAGRPDQE